MKLILASNNKGKVVEFREILAGTGIEVIPQREAGCDFEVALRWTPWAARPAYTARGIPEITRIPTWTGANSL